MGDGTGGAKMCRFLRYHSLNRFVSLVHYFPCGVTGRLLEGAGAYPRFIWAKPGYIPGRDASLSQGPLAREYLSNALNVYLDLPCYQYVFLEINRS